MASQSSKTIAQAGAIPFRIHPQEGPQVLLVTNKRGTRWVFPKGRIEGGHSPVEQARLETYEEAGVLGTVLNPHLGEFHYEKKNRRHHVRVYLLQVERILGTWPEEDRRDRVWVPAARLPRLNLRREAGDIVNHAVDQLFAFCYEEASA